MCAEADVSIRQAPTGVNALMAGGSSAMADHAKVGLHFDIDDIHIDVCKTSIVQWCMYCPANHFVFIISTLLLSDIDRCQKNVAFSMQQDSDQLTISS